MSEYTIPEHKNLHIHYFVQNPIDGYFYCEQCGRKFGAEEAGICL